MPCCLPCHGGWDGSAHWITSTVLEKAIQHNPKYIHQPSVYRIHSITREDDRKPLWLAPLSRRPSSSEVGLEMLAKAKPCLCFSAPSTNDHATVTDNLLSSGDKASAEPRTRRRYFRYFTRGYWSLYGGDLPLLDSQKNCVRSQGSETHWSASSNLRPPTLSSYTRRSRSECYHPARRAWSFASHESAITGHLSLHHGKSQRL